MKKPKKEYYRLKVSAATRNLEIVRNFVHQLAKTAGFTNEQIDQIELSVDEACTNVIKHAYHFDESKMIELEVVVDSEKMEIIITDYGGGFDPSKLDQPDINEFVKKAHPGGLGIHLMQKLMDDVKFNIIPGKKTEVHLIKYRKKELGKK